MVELDQIKQQLAACEEPLHEVKASLDLENKKKRIEELEMEMEAPGFWDDPDYSNKRMKELKNLLSQFVAGKIQQSSRHYRYLALLLQQCRKKRRILLMQLLEIWAAEEVLLWKLS